MMLCKKRAISAILAVLTAFCVLLTGILASPQPVRAAAFSPATNGTNFIKQEDPALIITGTGAVKGDGFQGNYKYLTKSQRDGIRDEASADQYFPSNQRDTYLSNTVYSARTKEEKGGWLKMTVSGLDLRAVAESMGIELTASDAIYTKGSDGHTSSLMKAFSKERYAFDAEDAQSGTRVFPAIALQVNSAGDGELPRFVFGQENTSDFNMLAWEKWLKNIWIGERENVLTLSINGQNRSYTLGDLIGAKSGSYTAQYQYMENGVQKTVVATGIPLNRFLADAGVGVNTIVKTSDGTTVSDPSRYFLAYDAEVNSEPMKTSGQLVLLGPGTTKDQVVKENITGISATVVTPANVAGLKAMRKSYNSIRIAWNRASGAQGYNIYRYEKGKRGGYQLLDCVEGTANTTYTDRGLKTGTRYYYKVKAYITVGSIDIEGAFSNLAAITPKLGKGKVRKVSRYGKRGIKIKWNRVSGANGYQIRLGTNRKTTKGRNFYTVKKGTTVSKTIRYLKKKNQKKKRRYYVKMRPYRKVSGKKVYGAYSAVKSIKR